MRDVVVEYRQPERLLFRLAAIYAGFLLTLRLSRFWGRTALRRMIWSSLVIAGEPLEYHGRPHELLGGAAVGLAVIAPMVVAITALNMLLWPDPVLTAAAADVYVLLLIFLFAWGDYMARRYQLSRTLWRGIRAGQDGSPLAYAGRYMLWTAAFFLTAGLSVPWAASDLARYTLRHTLWGDYRGSFQGSARQLLHAWLVTWVICIGPLLAVLLWMLSVSGWNANVILTQSGQILDLLITDDENTFVVWVVAVVLCYAGIVWLGYRLRWMEWYVGNAAIGPLHAVCRLDRYDFIRHAAAGILACTGIVLGCVWLLQVLARNEVPVLADLDYEAFVWFAIAVVSVAWAMLGCAFHGLVYFPLLRSIAAGTAIDNLAAADAVRQRSEHAGGAGFGEILTDSAGLQVI